MTRGIVLHLAMALLALSAISSARSEIPRVFEEEDFGNEALPHFLYAMSVDCDAAKIRLEVFDGDVQPVSGVGSYLIYHDYSTPLISSGITDAGGVVTHKLPGKISLMDGMFIAVLEKGGFRKKEVHFDITPCFRPETPPPPAEEEAPSVPAEEEEPPSVEEQPQEGETPPADEPEPPADESGADDGGTAAPPEEPPAGPAETGGACGLPAALALLAGSAFIAGRR